MNQENSAEEPARPVSATAEAQAAEGQVAECQSAEETPTQAELPIKSTDIRSVALTGLFILAVFYTLYFARAVLMPITIALLLNFLLRPVINGLKKIHIPPAFGAGIVLLVFVAVCVGAAFELSRPAADWMNKLPQMMRDVELKVRDLRRPVEKVSKVAQKVGEIGTLGTDQKTPEIKIKQSPLSGALLSNTQSFVASVAIIFILLYFLLSYGDFFLRKLIKVLPTLADKKKALTIAHEMEQHISIYLFTMSMINAGLGVAVGTAFYFIGLPNAVLWGVMAGLLNYIPYLGATVGITVTTFVALIAFNTIGHALLVPLCYFGLQAIEGNFVTPLIMGRRLTLNPVVIFVWLIFWGWLWSIPGALIAVPMLAAFKIFCDHIEPLSTISEFLGQ